MFSNFPYKNLLVIGIGGIGISALSKLLFDNGYNIYGINDQESRKTLNELIQKKIKIDMINTDTHINASKFDAVLYSVAWENNFPKLIESVKNTNKNVFTYSEALSKVSENFFLVAVSGSHGKTTTTAMICKILSDCRKSPTCIVGSLLDFGDGNISNYKNGKSNILVAEACEYRRHFLNYNPDLAVITNIDYEHADYYKTEEDFIQAFDEFKSKSKEVIDLNNVGIKKEDIPDLKVFGEHNIDNARLAVYTSIKLGVDRSCAIESIKEFKGVWRRQEYKCKNRFGALIFDDYAHHPTEIKKTIDAFASKFKDREIVLFFEPHTYSRTKAFFNEFIDVLSSEKISKLYICPTYPAREKYLKGADAKDLVEYLKKIRGVRYVTFDEVKNIINNLDKKYLAITMGAGDIYMISDIFCKNELLY